MRKIVIIIVSGMFFLIMPGAIRNGFGAVPYTFTSGTTAKAAEVNANFSDLDTRIGSLEGGQQGSTTSDGCIDKSLNPPDCSTCTTGSCTIGSTAYPAGNWVYLAKYTLPTHGELAISVGPSIVCTNDLSGAVLGLSLAVAADGPGFPPANPGSGVITYTELTLGNYPGGYELVPWKIARLSGRTMTQGVLTPGTTYKIFLFATMVCGTINGGCTFSEAPVRLQFTPLPAATVTITPN